MSLHFVLLKNHQELLLHPEFSYIHSNIAKFFYAQIGSGNAMKELIFLLPTVIFQHHTSGIQSFNLVILQQQCLFFVINFILHALIGPNDQPIHSMRLRFGTGNFYFPSFFSKSYSMASPCPSNRSPLSNVFLC